MRICVDLDGVVCQLRREGQTYRELEPVPGAVEGLRALRTAGHYIILHTARHMKTCQGNPGLATARIGGMTLEWLAQHEVPYDEIHFGKPWAHVYIDDNAVRFRSWDEIASDGSTLPAWREEVVAAAGPVPAGEVPPAGEARHGSEEVPVA